MLLIVLWVLITFPLMIIRGSDQRTKDSILTGLSPNSGDALEGPVEKQLRETGEWIVDTTEGQFRSSGTILISFPPVCGSLNRQITIFFFSCFYLCTN